MPLCSKCKKEKRVEDFYKDKRRKSGIYSACKKCHNEYFSGNKYPKEYYRKAWVKWWNKLSEKDRKKWRKLNSTSQKKWRQNNPNYFKNYFKVGNNKKKRDVRNLTNRRIKAKSPCEVCGNKVAEKHHPDYNKPLEVVWLCRQHHIDLHIKIKN